MAGNERIEVCRKLEGMGCRDEMRGAMSKLRFLLKAVRIGMRWGLGVSASFSKKEKIFKTSSA
ncbi:hypothetical protein AM500_05790 [Bacillus sp. FJAT-18017]|nr:hypothetical protein AM500_05790 [Bacillus sp. FJAT-18017]